MSAETVMNDLCLPIHRKLEGSGLEFALVIWNPQFAGQKSGVAVGHNPMRKKSDVSTALMTAAEAIRE